MGPVNSNYLLFHDHSCRPLIISCMFLLSRLYEHYCTLQFTLHLPHKILLSTFAELFRLTVCISETTVFFRFSALGTY